MIVCPLHWHLDAQRLVSVCDYMHACGAPTLKGYVEGDIVFLSQGTHRITAARVLGLIPRIVPIPWWRSEQALVNARFAAKIRGLSFRFVTIL